jgi:hypothetical protein
VPKKKNIDIDDAGGIFLFWCLAEDHFYAVQRIVEGLGGKGGLYSTSCVDKITLWNGADGCCAVKGRDAE